MSKSKKRRLPHQPKSVPSAAAPQIANLLPQALRFHQQGHLGQAADLYRTILRQTPNHFDARHLLGVIELQGKNFAAAATLIGRALRVNPHFAAAHFNLGIALFELKRHQEALASYDRALAIQPSYPDALINRGNALLALQRPQDALASYDRALALQPGDAEAIYNRGNALRDLDRHDEALAGYDRALAIQPGFAQALSSRANALVELQRYDQAIEDFERLRVLQPDFDYAGGQLLFAKLNCCDWSDYYRDAGLIAAAVAAGKRAASPFAFLAMSQSAESQLRCAQTYCTDRHPPSPDALSKHARYRHDKINIAYLSANFRNHAVSHLIVGLLEAHDKSRFEVTAVSFGPDPEDDVRTRLVGAVDRFLDVRGKTDRDTALLLKKLEIDIAVDLMGHTQGSHTAIFADRPTPVQVNWLGYPGTMGADYVDYIIADRHIIPEAQQSCYSEKVAYLPDTYQPNDGKRRIGANTPPREAAGLPETGFVFCSFNNIYKIVPPIFDIWMRLLREVEGSALWLVEGNSAAIRNLRRNADARGVHPDRLVFAPRTALADHLARHRLADLFLDTLPYNAHTTASDALWAGLPVVTCPGSTFAGRVAGSLLHAAGLPELVTATLAEYEALALRLAQDQNALAAIKGKLAANRDSCPLFDTDRFRRHIESAYQTMWERCQRGLPPVSFAVEAGLLGTANGAA